MAATVLVVDDDETIQQLLEVNLQMEGYGVAVATDGDEALTTIREMRPACVLLDVMMPGMDGWEVCRQLREDPELDDIPIVFLSARARQDDVDRGEQVGADAYITKPFDPIELIELIDRLVGLE